MALPASGAISLNQVNIELGNAETAQISLNDAVVRALFGKASGAISMSDGYGKSSVFKFNITSNTTNANLRTLAVNAGWDQTSPVEATVNSGVYVYATSTGNAALTINGSWPGGVTLVNNGYIIGMGGAGGRGYSSLAGSDAGPAISLGINCNIENNSYICGGGGGGGGGQTSAGGGGAGGGAGGPVTNPIDSLTGGGGGGPGANGAAGKVGQYGISGGGGGRRLPGVGATGTTTTAPGGGAGGAGGGAGGPYAGGSGGSNNSAGGSGASKLSGGGGGGWGASGGTSDKAGGAGGRAVRLNGYTVTWLANGTRWGAIS